MTFHPGALKPRLSASSVRSTADGMGGSHRADTETGCVCSDGEWHLCTECPETPDCTLPIDQKEAYRRKTRL